MTAMTKPVVSITMMTVTTMIMKMTITIKMTMTITMMIGFSGNMTAEVKSPSGYIPVSVDESVAGRSKVVFTPREEGQF
jgi:hypothetical protein